MLLLSSKTIFFGLRYKYRNEVYHLLMESCILVEICRATTSVILILKGQGHSEFWSGVFSLDLSHKKGSKGSKKVQK